MSGIMSMLLGAVSSAAAAVDEFFNRVTLLLPGNGTNGAQNNTFLDSSTNNFTITRNGNTTQGTFSPFSQTGWSNYFDGSGDNLTSTHPALNATFTIEAWIYRTSGAALQSIVHLNNGGVSGVVVYLDTSNYLVCTDGVNGQAAFSNLTVPINAWTHIAVVRSGGTTTGYVNGTVAGSHSFTPATVSAANIGAYNGSLYFPGYISNVRVVNGSAVYTGAFTPPTSPLTAITNTSLLTCQNNRFIDNSSNAYTITRTGDVSVQAFSPFLPTVAYSAATVGGSGFFDGTGDNLAVPTATANAVESGSFYFEAWVYLTNPSVAQMIIADPANTGGLFVGLNIDGGGRFAIGRTAVAVDNFVNLTWVGNQWYHLAVNRNGTSLQFFVNGTQVGSTDTNSVNYPSRGYRVGAEQAAGSAALTGYISGLRLVKSSVNTTNFTPPTAPPTAITNTALLLNFTNAGITDATAKNVLETVGNAQISTTQSKFGGSSMYFDGTGDYLIPNAGGSNVLYALGTGDFTIETWVYPTSFTGQSNINTIFDFRPASTNGIYPTLFLTLTNGYLTYFVNNSNAITTTSTPTLNTWSHVALVRSSGSTRLYLNGTQVGSTYTDTNNYLGSASRPLIGTSGFFVVSDFFTGYMDDFRITRFARYTANFTAPTSAFALQ